MLVLEANFPDGEPCRQLCRLHLHHNMHGLAGTREVFHTLPMLTGSKTAAQSIKCMHAWGNMP